LQDYGIEKNKCYLVMELLGQSLEELFRAQGKRFSVETVMQIGIQIVERLEAMHNKGFVHRDLKTTNLMVGRH
jgi:serine/threonine protein kinase